MATWKRLLILALAIAFLIPAAAATADDEQDDFTPPEGLREGWYARIDTDMGRILLRLFPDQAPQSVTHFVNLANGTLGWDDPVTGETLTGHYYDGVKIHKAEASQRFEAGDRTGTGYGAPDMYVPREGLGPRNFNSGGRIGMTRAAGGKISAVQFFVTAGAQPFLTGRHPCFGEVIDGKEVVQAITAVKTYSNGKPIEAIVIEKIRAFKVGNPPALAEPTPYWPQSRQIELRPDKQRD